MPDRTDRRPTNRPSSNTDRQKFIEQKLKWDKNGDDYKEKKHEGKTCDGHMRTRSSRDREQEMVIQKKETCMQETDI